MGLLTKHHTSNLKTLFDIREIPESTQLRSIIDEVDSIHFEGFFEDYFHRLQRGKYLEDYQLFPELYLCSLDGTQIFSSTNIECSGCLSQRHEVSDKKKKGSVKKIDEPKELKESKKSELTYSHKILQMALMHPDQRQVIPLMPELIQNEDGMQKQDCGTPRGVYQLEVKGLTGKQDLMHPVSSFELMEVTT